MEINNITFSYDDKRNHLEEISSVIDIGKITTIIGPNGCGKSTLLGVMSNHYTPQKGQVLIDGKRIQSMKAKQFAREIAVVHQQNTAPSDMTVERLIGYGRLPYKSFFSSDTTEDEAAVEWALRETSLAEKRHVTMDALSGGERQRVWIAMSLAQRTPFLFLDEPTTYLDIYYQYDILELIKRLNRELELTIVLVLHDINQAIRYSDTIITMKKGEIIKRGKPKEVITEQIMRDVYGVDVLIKENNQIGLYTLPIGI